MDDFFAELDAVIAESTAKSKLKSDREAAKKLANNPRAGRDARLQASADYKELSKLLEAEEWQIVSTVALFNEQQCDGCGSTHRIFLQYMERQSMVRQPTTQRYLRSPKPAPGAPTETLIQPHRTHICSDCCIDHGFALLEASYLKQSETMTAISPTYTQEDINAEAA